MKKLKLLLPIIVSFFFFACSEDNSIYEPQQKENITIDKVENEDQDEEEELPEGQLVPGFHTVKLQVTQPDGQIVERRFKYYMPIAAYGNPSLIFEFHGSWDYQKKGAIPDPIKYIGVSDPVSDSEKLHCLLSCRGCGRIIQRYRLYQLAGERKPFAFFRCDGKLFQRLYPDYR